MAGINIKLLHPNAAVPFKVDSGSAGFDLIAPTFLRVPPYQRRLLGLGVALEFDPAFVCKIEGRSSLALRGVDVGAGVVDSSYRGELKILLINNSNLDLNVTPGSRIGQLIFYKNPHLNFVVIEKLGKTSRGERGFGCSGY
jgi:dUTP pyrophosphatase